jgi:hypothetical protein
MKPLLLLEIRFRGRDEDAEQQSKEKKIAASLGLVILERAEPNWWNRGPVVTFLLLSILSIL